MPNSPEPPIPPGYIKRRSAPDKYPINLRTLERWTTDALNRKSEKYTALLPYLMLRATDNGQQVFGEDEALTNDLASKWDKVDKRGPEWYIHDDGVLLIIKSSKNRKKKKETITDSSNNGTPSDTTNKFAEQKHSTSSTSDPVTLKHKLELAQQKIEEQEQTIAKLEQDKQDYKTYLDRAFDQGEERKQGNIIMARLLERLPERSSEDKPNNDPQLPLTHGNVVDAELVDRAEPNNEASNTPAESEAQRQPPAHKTSPSPQENTLSGESAVTHSTNSTQDKATPSVEHDETTKVAEDSQPGFLSWKFPTLRKIKENFASPNRL